MTAADPIERYLDQLLIHLRGSARDVRRILSETEEHLRDAVSEAMAAGVGDLGVLPDGFSATVATSLYGVAAAVMLLLSLNAYVAGSGSGNGQWLSGAIVALAMTVAYGTSLRRTVFAHAAGPP